MPEDTPRTAPGARQGPGDAQVAWAFRPQPPAVLFVECDRYGRRVSKRFDDPAEARRFFALKDRAGKNPAVVRIPL
jgi:hypothetical protein